MALLALALPTGAADRFDATLKQNRQALQSAIAQAERQAPASALTRSDLLQQPLVADVMLSPNGQHVVYRRDNEQRRELILHTLDSGKDTRLLADADRVQAHWSSDGQHLWLSDAMGLAVMDLASRQARRVFKWDARREQRLWHVDSRAPGMALISEKIGPADHRQYRYLRIDLRGRTALLHESAWPLREALLDREGRLAFSSAYDSPRYDTVIRRHSQDGARELLRCRGIEQCRLLGFAESGDSLMMLSHHREDKLALQRWHANQPRWQTLHRDPAGIADAGALLWPPGGDDWLAIAYHSDHRQWHGRNPRIEAQLVALQNRLPRANLDLSSSADGQRWLVQASHATWARDRYYVYAPERDALTPLFGRESSTSEQQIRSSADALPLRYRSRDGWPLHGYVYLPRGVELARAPLIAILHGGPFNRSKDEFDPIVQLLVSRGHVVFTPNFRASTGYGMRHVLAADGDFGNGRVLADITEGLDAVLALGIGDPERQAVIGHSFGGYASLLAASHHRDRFRFAVASAAPVEFAWSMQWIEENDGSALPADGPPGPVHFSHFGLPTSDPRWQQKMRRDSPLAHVEALKTPIYLWAGARDDRVPIQSIVRYAGDLRRSGVPTTLLIDPESGHNPHQALAFEAIIYLVELAAHRHFGSALTPPSAALQTFLNRNIRL